MQIIYAASLENDTLADQADDTLLETAVKRAPRPVSDAYQAKIDTARAAARKNGWPALKGTTAQKRWAATIRDELSRNRDIPEKLFDALTRHYLRAVQWIELRDDMRRNAYVTVLKLKQLPWLK